MDFINGLPKTAKQHDAIMVMVDELSKVAYFISIKFTNSTSKITQIFIRETVRLCGIPKKIVLGKYVRFTCRFWKEMFA